MIVSDDNVQSLATVITTAFPVIAVAFYTVRNAPDGLDGAAPSDLQVPMNPWAGRIAAQPWVKELLWLLGNCEVSNDPRTGRVSLVFQDEFRIGTDRGFVYRAPAGILLALTPFLLGESSRLGRIAIGISFFLLVFSLDALILYSTAISSIRLELSASRPARPAAEPRKRHQSYPGTSVVIVAVIGVTTGAISLVAGGFLALSTPM
jgi:hypothetical protein